MRTIHKYELAIVDEQTLQIPFSFRPLCVQYQGGKLVLWCEVETFNPPKWTTIYICGTGNPLDGRADNYIGTVQQPGTGLVWHIYY